MNHSLSGIYNLKSFLLLYLCLFGTIETAHAKNTESDANQTLTMCIDHYPPLQVIKPNGEVTGENVELTRNFFLQLGFQLEFTDDVPFKRCLQWLKDGKVDLMTGLLDAPKRQKDYHMFMYDDLTVKSFFVAIGGPKIKSFSDLQGLNIAVVRGARQFKTFDEAPRDMFRKTFVNTLSSGFGMLYRGRVDAVVCTDYYGDNILKNHSEFAGKIVKAEYDESDGTKVYIAISRKSVFAAQADKIANKAKEIYESGTFKQWVQDFRLSNPELY